MTDQANRPVAEITGDLDRLCIDTIRTLSMGAVQAANPGHPDTPMALAPVAYCPWQRHLRFDPADPIWPDRDRFILSNGHASPIEQLASLRAMPGILVIRPADANEVTEAWRVILPLRHEPTALVLSRLLLPTLDRARYAPASGLARGGYVHCAHPADPDQIRLRARPCDRGGQGPAGPLAPGMSHVPTLSARHQKEGRMP
jgi:transketolase